MSIPLGAAVLLAICVIGIFAIALAARIYIRRMAERDMRRFEARFPGRCPICSFHEYGILHGHVRLSDPVDAHSGCPEGMARWTRRSPLESGGT